MIGGLGSEAGPEDSLFDNPDLIMMMEGKANTVVNEDETSPFLRISPSITDKYNAQSVIRNTEQDDQSLDNQVEMSNLSAY